MKNTQVHVSIFVLCLYYASISVDVQVHVTDIILTN